MSLQMSKKVLVVVDGTPPKSIKNKFPEGAHVISIQDDTLSKETIEQTQETLKKTKPNFVMTMGAKSLKATLKQTGIQKMRGMPQEIDGAICFPTLAPGYIKRYPGTSALLFNDLTAFKRIVKQGNIEQHDFKYNVVTLKNLDDCLDDLSDHNFLSFDTETSGTDPFAPGAWMTSIGFGTKLNNWTIPLNHRLSRYFEKFNYQQKIVDRLHKVVKGKKLIAHNGKFDLLWTWLMYGHRWKIYFDTILAHHLLDENSPHDLTSLSGVYLRAPAYDIPLTDKHGLTGTLENHCRYLSLDLHYTKKLHKIFYRDLMADRLVMRVFKELSMPALDMYTDIEKDGLYISEKRLDISQRFWKRKRQKALKVLNKLCPSDQEYKDKKTKKIIKGINWNSPTQLAVVLFGEYEPNDNPLLLHEKSFQGLSVIEETAGGSISCSESVLLRCKGNKVAQAVLELRESAKKLSTYIEAWQSVLYDQHIHPSFKIHGTVTGRPSCLEPPLQQTPRDPRVRSLISAKPGWVLLDADYSQIELRVAAILANETRMLADFLAGRDPHWTTLLSSIEITHSYYDEICETFKKAGVSFKTIPHAVELLAEWGAKACQKLHPTWKEARVKAKAENFGFLYGMWWRNFIIYARDDYGVDITVNEAKQSREAFFTTYPAFGPWHEKQKDFVHTEGYVRSLSGRVRHLDAGLMNDRSPQCMEAERQAINAPVQAFAAELTMMAGIEIHKHPQLDRSFFRLGGTVHDSLLMNVRRDKVLHCLPIIDTVMRNPVLLKKFNVTLNIPLDIEIDVGPWSRGVQWTPGMSLSQLGVS